MRLSNFEMSCRLEKLRSVLDTTGLLGYAAARNYRKLTEQLVEYEERKNELVRKYGHDDGMTCSISPDDENYIPMIQELDKYAQIKHEVEIMERPMSEAVEQLSGQQIIDIWWMLNDDMEVA